ncbi:MAG: sigma-70 family RNA polymerase sigma factor [Kiritimatiellae bacterium]|nr:sigma-70 family RNA polymerase sigma factor [Kiritimatiellia bacterium]
MSADDVQTIEAVLAGDVERYAELVDRYQETALRTAYSMLGNYEDARDVAQEAFVRAYRGLHRFRLDSRFSTWLHRIVLNACKDLHRHRARRPQAAGDEPADQGPAGLFADAIEDSGPNPAEQLSDRELGERLSEGIARLSPQQRAAFVLHHFQELALQEVAAVMRCRVGSVKSHLHRATNSLRAWMSPTLGTPEQQP